MLSMLQSPNLLTPTAPTPGPEHDSEMLNKPGSNIFPTSKTGFVQVVRDTEAEGHVSRSPAIKRGTSLNVLS